VQLTRILDRVYLRIAGLTIQVTCVQQDLNIAPGRASAPFTIEPAPPDVRVDVVARDRDESDGARECLFDSGGPWRLYRHADGFLFRFFSSTLPSHPYKTALFSHDFSTGRVHVDRPFFAAAETIDPLEYPLDELLVISLLGQGRGIEIHGCGVIDRDGTGYLFVGPSGAGKSTIARLWLAEHGTAILSDDRVILRNDGDGLWMYGTPWHGEEPLASPRRSRLARLFFLRQHTRDDVIPVAKPDGVARLFAASFPPFHSARALDFTLEFLDRLGDCVPWSELRFRPTRALLDVVRIRV
jgi:hypothetical protein